MSKFPEKIEAMKAGSVPDKNLDVYENAGWFAQEKLDGTHIVASKTSMMTRSWKNDVATLYPEIAAELSVIEKGTILDGELVFYRKDNGKSEFLTALATPEMKEKYNIRLMLFDVLSIGNTSWENIPQNARCDEVEAIVTKYGWKHIGFIPRVYSGFNAFYKATIEAGGEGIFLKRSNTLYKEGTRTQNWLKAKKVRTDDCFILGLASGNGKYADSFGALVVGQLVDGKIQVVARVSGMTDEIRADFNSKIRSMPADNSLGDAFWKGATGKDVFHKVAPNMVVEVEFMERTTSGSMRHPRFLRVRDDKPWTECEAIFERGE